MITRDNVLILTDNYGSKIIKEITEKVKKERDKGCTKEQSMMLYSANNNFLALLLDDLVSFCFFFSLSLSLKIFVCRKQNKKGN